MAFGLIGPFASSASMLRTFLALSLATVVFLHGCGPNSPRLSGRGSNPNSPSEAEITFKDLSLRAQAKRLPVIVFGKFAVGKEPGDVTVDDLKETLSWANKEGVTPISLNDLRKHLTEGTDIPERSMLLAFAAADHAFYESALPLLKQSSTPFAAFVAAPDSSESRTTMAKDELLDIARIPGVEIGAFIGNDVPSSTTQVKKARTDLEQIVGQPVRYGFVATQTLEHAQAETLKDAGFVLTIDQGESLAEESPSIMQIGSYSNSNRESAWKARNEAVDGTPVGIYEAPINDAPVKMVRKKVKGVDLILVSGGLPLTAQSSTRQGVMQFVDQNEAIAGINGTFFSMASISGTSNRMVGPCKTADMPMLIPDNEPGRWPKLRNRPFVIWGPKRIGIVPFQPESMESDEIITAFMSDFTDCFLAGAWLIHNGVARTAEEIEVFGSRDADDPRRRAFFGIMQDGSVVLGASRSSARSETVAAAAAELGVVEAVLLDSGFSTSLVFDGKILASGHSTDTMPSRPVPHAILLKGKKEEKEIVEDAAPESVEH